MRLVVLDTETTGLDHTRGDRIIEIGCVELLNRRLTGHTYHQYINPQCAVSVEAQAIHGITDVFLADKPIFAKVAQELLQFIAGAELVMHNAPFDVGFLDHELALWAQSSRQQKISLDQHCQITDSLMLARAKHPGQKNNLDALCKRYGVDNSQRDLHGALLDSELDQSLFEPERALTDSGAWLTKWGYVKTKRKYHTKSRAKSPGHGKRQTHPATRTAIKSTREPNPPRSTKNTSVVATNQWNSQIYFFVSKHTGKVLQCGTYNSLFRIFSSICVIPSVNNFFYFFFDIALCHVKVSSSCC